MGEGEGDGEKMSSREYYLLHNKPDRAKMRPDCVSACIDHVTYDALKITIEFANRARWVMKFVR